MHSQRKGLRSASAAVASTSSGIVVDDAVPSTSQQSETGNVSSLPSQLNKVNIRGEEGSSENDESEEYGDMHRLVLQGVMAAGYLDATGVKKLFKEACKLVNCKVPPTELTSPPFIQKVVREINERIKVFDMMIRSATCEITGEKFYVYLVTVEKQVMKFQTYFTKPELEYFQKIMDTILMKHNDFSLSMTECVNIGGEMNIRGFGKEYAEAFIERMISMQYFTRVNANAANDDDDDFEITLGFRTIREFEPVFSELYKDCFSKCCLCKMIVLNGLQCPRCPTVIHRGCLQKYLKDVKICTECKGPWKKKGLLVRTRDGVGKHPSSANKAFTPNRTSQQSTGGPAVKRTRTATATEAAAGGEVDMPFLEPMVSPRGAGNTSPRRPMASGRTARRGGASGSTSTPGARDRVLRARPRFLSDSDSN